MYDVDFDDVPRPIYRNQQSFSFFFYYIVRILIALLLLVNLSKG